MSNLPVPIGGTVLPPVELTDELGSAGASAQAYMRADSAEATRRAYASDWRDFLDWCHRSGLQPLPAAPEAVADYLAQLADRELKASTIGRRVAAITWVHRQNDLVPPTSAELVKRVLRGIRRTIGARVDRKAPVTAQIVRQMVKKVPGTPAGLRDRALLLLGFATAMRRSELVALDVEDIRRVPEGLVVHVRRSKTDQEGVGREVPVPRGNRLKPVAALEAWLQAAAIMAGPIFRPVGKGGRVANHRLDGVTVGHVVKRWAAAASLDPTMFGGHSLRAGFVTEALGNDADALKIMDITGHRQVQTLKIYDRRAKAFQDHAGKKFL